jgi:hypothetical protein
LAFTSTRVTTLTCERSGRQVECVATEPEFLSSLTHPVAHGACKADVHPTPHGARLSISGKDSVLELISHDAAELEILNRALNGFFVGQSSTLSHQLVREPASVMNLTFYGVALLSYLAVLMLGERQVRVTRPRAHSYVIEQRSWVGGSVLSRFEFNVAPHVADEAEVVKQRVASREFRTLALSDGERRLLLPAPEASQVEAVRAQLVRLAQ